MATLDVVRKGRNTGIPIPPKNKTQTIATILLWLPSAAKNIQIPAIVKITHPRTSSKLLLSNAYTDFIVDLYRDYKQTKISASRAINSKASQRGKVDEILVKNYD
jgi:site-specific DNA-adenine methylase